MVRNLLRVTIVCLTGSFLCLPFSFAGFEEDPIKATQSDTVAVTEELLTREGDIGPASPTIKIEDTSEFLTEVPYDEVKEGDDEATFDDEKPWWERWFFWLDDEEKKRDETH